MIFTMPPDSGKNMPLQWLLSTTPSTCNMLLKDSSHRGLKSKYSTAGTTTRSLSKNKTYIVAPTSLECFFLINNTRATKKLLTPELAFWSMDETKNSAHGKVKREDWTGREKEKVGQLCPNAETSDSGPGYGRKHAGVKRMHLINQSTVAVNA